MKLPKASTLALTLLVASCFIQIGAQLFALVVIAGPVAEAPPRSLAIFEGPYGYDSSGFWSTVPMVTAVLFLVALAANWKNGRRTLLLVALAMFVIGGAVTALLAEPIFSEMMKVGYHDHVDPVLQRRAARWHALDWTTWSLVVLAGVALMVALLRPVTTADGAAADRAR